MEIGHNVMHGQYDWMNDPALYGKKFEWDNACPADQWRHSHNYMHHTHTNIVGKDRDIGYGMLRMSEDQRWHPTTWATPSTRPCSRCSSSTGSRSTTSKSSRIAHRRDRPGREARDAGGHLGEGAPPDAQGLRALPAALRPLGPFALAGNATANLVRNLWSFTIIFCGHFPEGTHEFTEEEAENETRGQWYYRQLLGSANLTGGRLFHILAGNLSFQIEHHLFPDLPAHRYAEISTRSARSASATASPTTPGRCASSSAASCARSSSSPYRHCLAAAGSEPDADETTGERGPRKLATVTPSARQMLASPAEEASKG